MITKLNLESFSPLWGSWTPKFEKFFLNSGFDPIYKRIKEESARGHLIAPESKNVFRAFQETDIDNVKAIVVGLSPYHSFIGNKTIADGLCMSCEITGKLQPSLLAFYSAMELELNYGEESRRSPSLKYLANDGLLLLNFALTTTKNKAGNHCLIWEPFMKYLFEEVIDTNGIPVWLLGKEASKLERYIQPFTWIFKTSHPASASYRGDEQWDSEGTFKKINTILKENNNQKISWIQTN